MRRWYSQPLRGSQGRKSPRGAACQAPLVEADLMSRADLQERALPLPQPRGGARDGPTPPQQPRSSSRSRRRSAASAHPLSRSSANIARTREPRSLRDGSPGRPGDFTRSLLQLDDPAAFTAPPLSGQRRPLRPAAVTNAFRVKLLLVAPHGKENPRHAARQADHRHTISPSLRGCVRPARNSPASGRLHRHFRQAAALTVPGAGAARCARCARVDSVHPNCFARHKADVARHTTRVPLALDVIEGGDKRRHGDRAHYGAVMSLALSTSTRARSLICPSVRRVFIQELEDRLQRRQRRAQFG